MYESATVAELRTVLAVNRKGISAEEKLAILGRGMWSHFNLFSYVCVSPLLTSIWEELSQQCLPSAYRALKGTKL